MTLYTGAFSLIVASAAAAIATGWSESCRAGFALLKNRAFARRTKNRGCTGPSRPECLSEPPGSLQV
jgi:hypothetical protein